MSVIEQTRKLPPPHPRLLVGREGLAELRARAGTSQGERMVRRMKDLLRLTPDGIDAGYHAAGYGFLYLLEQNVEHAEHAGRLLDSLIHGELRYSSSSAHREDLWNGDYKMTLRTDPAVGAALAYDFCYNAWSYAFREWVAGKLATQAWRFIDGGGRGWNGSPASHWQANTRSAAGICALAVANDPGGETSTELLHQAVAGLLAYIETQSGDRGWTQEGFEYYCYPMAHHVLPFLSIYRRLVGAPPFAGTAADWFALFPIHALIADLPWVSLPNSRNRVETNRWYSGAFPLGFGAVPEGMQNIHLWAGNQRHGPTGDGTHGITMPHHAIFALADYPEETELWNPDTILDRVWCDRKKGLFLFRNGWQDSDDFVVGVDVNTHPADGAGKPQSAGAFNVVGLGKPWLVTCPLGRRTRECYNVVAARRTTPQARGHVLEFDPTADGGGVLVMDLSDIYGVSCTRRLDIACVGHGVDLTVYDRFADELPRQWVVHTPVRPALTPTGFRVRQGDDEMDVAFARPTHPDVYIAQQGGVYRVQVEGRSRFRAAIRIARGHGSGPA